MAQVTSPIILDSTGQQIHSDLQQIKTVLTTPSVAEDITFDNTGTGMQADDVQDAITELKSNLTQKFAVVEFASVAKNNYTEVDYPSGFTLSNCVILSLSYQLNNGSNNWVGGADGLGNTSFQRFFVRLSSTKVGVYTTDINIETRKARVVLMRIDI